MSNPLELPPELEEALGRLNRSSRRSFLAASGALAITLSLGAVPRARALAQAPLAPAGPYPDPDFLKLDTWIVIHPDNTATFFVGKTDGGQGTGTAFRQMMCDELDIAYDKTRLVMGCTDITPDQGGSGGSTSVERDGRPMRRVAAEARRALLELGGKHLAMPVEMLVVANATISVRSNPQRNVTYAELIGGKRFNIELTGQNVNLTTGKAAIKPVSDLRVVGRSHKRYDIPPKVDGSAQWAVDMKLPRMVHARNVRPPFAGATLQHIDETSVRDVPGFIRVISRGNYVAVICEREEQAIRAARQLKAQWQRPKDAPFPASSDLFDYMRRATPTSTSEPRLEGDPDAAFKGAARVIEADFEVPFQGHSSIGPAHALADPSDGQMTIYTNDMKAYSHRTGVAKFLDMPREKVRVVYMDGPQVYGRTAADDAGFEAAFLAKELGRPVRVQWMREEEAGWDTKGPAHVIKLRGGLDERGKLVALQYDACSADYNHLWYNEPDTVLIAQLMGIRPAKPAKGSVETPTTMYAIPNQRMLTRIVGLPLIWETPLRTGNLRDPNGPQVTFAYESFIDELAATAKADPIQFRLDMLEQAKEDEVFRKSRSLAVVRAAAKAYGWETRPSPKPQAAESREKVVSGRGIAYTYRSNTIVAVIAEVEVNRETGRVWAKRLVCAHDCGLVVNPETLHHTVECGMLHGLSRALWEEVQFDTEKVTSVNWASYPSLRHSDTPEAIDIVLVNGDPNPDRPDLAPYGAGECSHKPLIAAIANAIYDATGVRLRRAPFRSERVLAALQAHSA
ncbi:MAG TPA: molybdopterin cofactor-binding domain-containing protein [Steroidobacteraceae bacterium]